MIVEKEDDGEKYNYVERTNRRKRNEMTHHNSEI